MKGQDWEESEESEEEVMVQKFRFGSFCCQSMNLFVKAKSSATLEVDFLPMSIGKHECSIVLCDQEVGEMEYKIDAVAILPKAFVINTIHLDFSKQNPLRIPITANNPQYENAKKEHMRWL